MSERKVLNKYYPPDFDPSKIPRMKLPKNRQYTVRLMAPFNMRCATCGEYIYKGKKFNARKEDVEGEDYLGIRIYRFYIKCTRCLQEISFRTDPKSTDYEIEAGAIRNFMALKKAEEQAKREIEEEKEEEANNPMKMLENRTEQSKQEMELVEALEELRELNVRQGNVDFDAMLKKYNDDDRKTILKALQDELDNKEIRNIYGQKKRVVEVIEEVVDEDEPFVSHKKIKLENCLDKASSCVEKKSKLTTSTISLKNISSFIKKKEPTQSTSQESLSSLKPDSTTSASSQKTNATPSEDPNEKKSEGLLLLGSYSSSENSSGDET